MIKRLLHTILGHDFYTVSFNMDIYRGEIALIWKSRLLKTVPKNKENKQIISECKKVELCNCGKIRATKKTGEVTNFYL